MSLEHQLPVLMKKTQMSSDRPQCGLTSLLPMSCRGRAEAFARRLHTRLRNLGSASADAGESRWLASHEVNGSVRRESGLFYDFELECESPSSPVDEYDAPFPERSPSDDGDIPFYDVDSEPDVSQRSDISKYHMTPREAQTSKTSPPRTNGFTYSSTFFTENSPIKSQPAARESSLTDGRLFSAITFDDCESHDTIAVDMDETDSAPRLSPPCESSRHSAPLSSIDSNIDFESTNSEPFDLADEAVEDGNQRHLENDSSSDCVEDISEELVVLSTENIDASKTVDNESLREISPSAEVISNEDCPEIVSEKIFEEKENSPSPEEDHSLLRVDAAQLVEEAGKDEEVEADERPQRVRRCSSLKTGKTPPGTPGHKKIVRFADVLGLDLADVKTFMDDIPVIPKSAYEDLANADLSISVPPARTAPKFGALSLVPLFQAPRDLTEALEKRCVCLESARVADGSHITVCGSVRVRNLDYNKTVHVRYTMDGWKTYTDLQATYVPGSCDGFSDRFQFLLYAPSILAGQRLEFAVRFQCKGRQYWDSNFGVNYCYDCLPLGAPPASIASTAAAASTLPLHPTRDWHPSFY